MLCKDLILLVLITAPLGWRVSHSHRHCTIYDDLLRREVLYDCSGRKLHGVPVDIPANVTAIDLSYNRITRITPGNFGRLRNLSRLDLSDNRIGKLELGAFTDVPKLRMLNLRSNYLRMDYESLPRGVFKNLSQLQWLDLKNNTNRYPKPKENYPDETLKDLTGLTELYVDGLNMENSVLGPGFASLKTLSLLDFSGDNGRCNLKKLSKNVFYNLRNSQLEYLDLAYCELYKIDNFTFSFLQTIKTLDISGNKYLGLNRLGGVFYGLQNSSLERLILNATTSRESRTYMLYSSRVFHYLQNITTLKHLTLDSNSISDLESNTHVYLEHLETLSLSDNIFLNAIMPAFDLSHLQHLKYLNWSWTFRSKPEVQLKQLERGEFTFTIISAPNLEVADLNNNDLQYPLNHIIVHNATSLRFLNLSNNNFYEWNGPWEVLDNSFRKMHTLDLSGNNCRKISETFLYNFSTTHVLHLQNNRLGYSDTIANGSHTSPFGWLVNLTYVDISSNEMEKLSPNLFNNNTKLQTMMLRNNYLTSDGLNLDLKNISFLDLAYNKLGSLNAKMRSVLDDVQTREKLVNVVVNLAGNPLQCTCETEQFFVWMQKTKVQFVGQDDYQCTLKNGSIVSIKQLSAIVGHLKVTCASKFTLTLVSVVVSLVIITVVASAVYYRFRWEIKYFFYKLRIRRKEYEEVHGDDNYQYDAFVAFSKEDYKWVYRQLRPNLEDAEAEQDRLRLCLHHRDFLPGEDIEENIIQSISQSRKTVLVISRNFVRSNWCYFEMKMARMRLFEEGKDVLVLILLEDIPFREMNDTLFHLFKSKSYLEWPDNQRDQDVFWKKIRMVLKRNNDGV
ncbi:toll-like receptor 13 [Lingula anatina]|uniref:Toll-like receptor 13 n=1 Tax=Lingula anatina TaxID=7574 RepID=A0A1S3HFY9_LINAN|nr:toll-like receptor 13 [Lingula anatina]|eukprot:XP_013384396.1 toll-like receptor 13 [Lingula anatina]